MSDLLEFLRLGRDGLFAGVLVAGVCGYIGVYVVLKRIVFVGASLAQISSAGVALSFMSAAALPWLGRHPLAVSLVITLLGTLLYSQQTLSRKVPQESIIGIGYLVASALTLILIVQSPKGLDEVKELLDGHLITVDIDHLRLLLGSSIAAAAIHGAFYKQFLFVSFDREMAATQGFNVRAWEIWFYVILGAIISISIQCAGLLAVFAYLVIPPVTGLLVARRMRTAFVVSVGCAVLATILGFLWSLKADLPTSPPTIAVATLLLGVAWLVARVRGD